MGLIGRMGLIGAVGRRRARRGRGKFVEKKEVKNVDWGENNACRIGRKTV